MTAPISNGPTTHGYTTMRDATFPHVWAHHVVCGATGVLGAAWSVWAGLLVVPVGGGPPASRPRRELRSARRLEARPGPAAAHGHGSQALPPPTGLAAVPSGPSGTHRIGSDGGLAALGAVCQRADGVSRF